MLIIKMSVSVTGIIIGVIAVLATCLLVYFMTNKKLPDLQVVDTIKNTLSSTESSSTPSSMFGDALADPHPLHT
jgi:hypothetical protein